MQTKNPCPDDFVFDSMDMTEDILRYTTGGYSPIIIGNILSDPSGKSSYTYRIVNKLGYGHNAAVWLAQQIDTAGNRAFVAVKVTTSDVEAGMEASILEAASMPEPSNILSYLDSFTIQSPNGTHSVIVTDVVAPTLRSTSPRLYKEFAYGLAQGLAHLHAAGIVHGDLHLGNVGHAMPQLALQNSEDVMVDLLVQDITLVLPTDPANQSASLPAYLLIPCDLRLYHARIANDDPLRIKIIDFGSARISGVLPLHPQCAIAVSPPEAAFAQNIEKTGNPLAGHQQIFGLLAPTCTKVSQAGHSSVGLTGRVCLLP